MAWEPDYVTEDQFKAYVKIELDDEADNTFIAADITAASRAIDKCCSNRPNGLGARRQFGKVAASEARYYQPRWDRDQGRWVVEIDDLAVGTGLAIAVDLDNDDVYESTVTDYVLRPRDAVVNNRPFTQISIGIGSAVQPTDWPDSVRVTTDQWGWSAVPATVFRACLIQTHRFNKRRVSPFGVKGSPQKQTQQSLMDQVDADVEQMLAPYIKIGWTP